MNCPTSEQLHAYHDDRLPVDVRAGIERHVAGCPACSLELARLTGLSKLLAASVGPQLSQIARHRLRGRLADAMEQAGEQIVERRLIRIGWSLSGIAASILVIGSGLLMRTSSSQAEPVSSSPPPWAAVENAATVSTDSSALPATPVAQWYLADAGSAAGEQP